MNQMGHRVEYLNGRLIARNDKWGETRYVDLDSVIAIAAFETDYYWRFKLDASNIGSYSRGHTGAIANIRTSLSGEWNTDVVDLETEFEMECAYFYLRVERSNSYLHPPPQK